MCPNAWFAEYLKEVHSLFDGFIDELSKRFAEGLSLIIKECLENEKEKC